MPPRKATGLLLASVFPLALLLGSCTKEKAPASSAEIKQLRDEVAAMRSAKGEAPKAANAPGTGPAATPELSALKAENQALKSGLLELEPLRDKLENAERETQSLRREIEELKKANAELRAKSVFRSRSKAIGETLPELVVTPGTVYKQVVIRTIEDDAVTIRHEGGVATLRGNALPKDWVKRFSLGEPAVLSASLADSATAAPAAPPKVNPALPAPGDDQDPDALPNRLTKATVIIRGDRTQGTGFFARDGNAVYLYTAAHVLSGNTTLEARTADGRSYTRFGAFQYAEGSDMVRLAMLDEVPCAAEPIGSGTIEIGTSIFAIGNSGGGGVLNVLHGTVRALGPNEVELDAGVIQGNSGGPVFTSPGGRVIGVVTHLVAARDDVWSTDTQFREVRRFAARLGPSVRWREMSLATFLAEPRTLTEYNRVTRLLLALAVLRPTKNGMRLDVSVHGSYTALSILEECRDMAAVSGLLQMNTGLAQNNMRSADADLLKKYSAYYSNIYSAARRQSYAFDPARFSFYHRSSAKLAATWRATAENAISSQVSSFDR